MPTLFDYFSHDFKGLRIEQNNTINYQNKFTKEILWEQQIYRSCWCSINTGFRQLSYFIPKSHHYLLILKHIISNIKKDENSFLGTLVHSNFPGDIEIGEWSEIYSKRIFIYCDNKVTENDKIDIEKNLLSKEYLISIRDPEYLFEKNKVAIPVAFISHDSRDKEIIARPLALALHKRLCFTWYDEFSLKVGQNLRESIEKGIKEAKKCILILTPNFLSNNGWTKKEFNSIFTKELLFDEKLILPIWHNVSKKNVYEYSPDLLNTFALTCPDIKTIPEDEYNKEFELLISRIHSAISE